MEDIDLDRDGISVIPIYGVHFDVYAKLFSGQALPKKCAIITDGDLKPSDSDPELEGEDDLPPPPDLEALQNEFVRVFACKTTFERDLVFEGTLEMFALAAESIGAPIIAKHLRDGAENLDDDDLGDDEKSEILRPLRKMVLNTAKRFGKARFAQIAARHADKAEVIPKYLADAAEWLRSP